MQTLWTCSQWIDVPEYPEVLPGQNVVRSFWVFCSNCEHEESCEMPLSDINELVGPHYRNLVRFTVEQNLIGTNAPTRISSIVTFH
jgi:hypothetical protein